MSLLSFLFHQPHRVLFLASKIVNVVEFDRWYGADSGGGLGEASLHSTRNNLWATVSFFRAPQPLEVRGLSHQPSVFFRSHGLLPCAGSLFPSIAIHFRAVTHTLGFKIVLIYHAQQFNSPISPSATPALPWNNLTTTKISHTLLNWIVSLREICLWLFSP